MELFDVTVVGGGPAGLFATFYSGLREMKTKIIEYQPQFGGKVNVYPEKMVWDIGGLTPITGAQLIEQMTQQSLTFHPSVVLNEKVVEISKHKAGHFELKTASGACHFSKTVIVAIGGGILKPQKLNIEGARKFDFSNLHYTVKSLMRFKDKTIIISGGGNTAIDWANELQGVAKKIYLTYRKEALKGHESQVSKLMDGSIECLLNTSISKLIANEEHTCIETVELTSQKTGETRYLAVDDVIISHGYERDLSLLKKSKLPVKLIKDCYIKGNANSESSVPGLYAAGDILHHEGKLHLISGAFQDAANAVNKAKIYIQPNASLTGRVSSHNELFASRNRTLVQQMIQNEGK